MKESDVISFSATARAYRVHRVTIADLVRTWGLEPYPMPSNGKGKGLDARQRRILRRKLNLSRRAEAAVAS